MKIKEAKNVINYLLDNNLKLVEKGQSKLSIGLEGDPGIGKTSLIAEIAKERDAKYVRVELSSLEEVGDLIGVPIKEFMMYSPEGDECWIAEKLIEEHSLLGYKLCSNCSPRMSYAIPSWVPENEDQEVLLVLDDFNRATSLFMQAIMSLIQFNEYISWKLPKKTHLLLTSNPDNGENSVTSLDAAQSSRLINFYLDFDPVQYGEWMDNNNLRNEAINFMLLHPEIFDTSKQINARTYTMFASALDGISNLSSDSSFDLISYIAKGCFGNNTNIGELFITFINNNLDKLMTAEEIVSGTWADTEIKLKDNVIKDGMFRADIASVLTLRLINYVRKSVSDKKNIDKVVTRINDIVDSNELLLTEDLIYMLIKELCDKFPQKCRKLLLNPKVQSKLIA